ncbi:nucleoside-triphosphatase [Penaeicola halotolerans]|uniref:nucleoside-triphosphatase n=1 Tax=Penaeicola halotolerans TaxID=2793196 RepID=UPI001CF85CCD|nr:nucleoside-triphosphatase [Penaeicola halotolerans]
MSSKIYLLVGPKHSGKTTALQTWSEKKIVSGFLSPKVMGERFFQLLPSRKLLTMEAVAGEPSFAVGKYLFSKANFQEAQVHTIENMHTGWMIIDEIGPLELGGEGFDVLLKLLLGHYQGNLIIVLREELLEEAIQHYQLQAAKVIQKEDLDSL